MARLPPARVALDGHRPLTALGDHHNQRPPPPPHRTRLPTAHTDALGGTLTGTSAAALAYQDSRNV